MYSTTEAAALLRKSPETVRRWCKRGRIHSVQLTPRGAHMIPSTQFMLNSNQYVRLLLGQQGPSIIAAVEERRADEARARAQQSTAAEQ